MNMHIRKAEFQDIDKITRLGMDLIFLHTEFEKDYYLLEENADMYFQSWVKSQLNSPSSFILVAETDPDDNQQGNFTQGEKQVVGLISGFIKYLFPWFKVKKVGHISFMIVNPSYRQKGVGKMLESEAKKWFRSENIGFVELYVDEKNSVGNKVWQNLGFLPFKNFLKKPI